MEIRINAEAHEVAEFCSKLGIKADIFDVLANARQHENLTPEKTKILCTCDRAYEKLLEHDPNSSISKTHIRRLITQRILPVATSGRKQLIDFNDLLDYLNNPDKYRKPKTHKEAYGKIRPLG